MPYQERAFYFTCLNIFPGQSNSDIPKSSFSSKNTVCTLAERARPELESFNFDKNGAKIYLSEKLVFHQDSWTMAHKQWNPKQTEHVQRNPVKKVPQLSLWQLLAEKVAFQLKRYLFDVHSISENCVPGPELRESVFAGQEPFQPKRYLFSVHTFY